MGKHTSIHQSRDTDCQYAIVVKGYLDESLGDWLGGLSIARGERGVTIITGSIPDQSALFGVLIKMRDLGITLISLSRLDRDENPG